MMYCSIGERITILRKRNNLTKKALAEIVGVSAATITNYEKGKTLPSAEITVKLALALNVSVNELITLGDPDKNANGAMSVKFDEDSAIPDYRRLLEECNEILKNKNISLK